MSIVTDHVNDDISDDGGAAPTLGGSAVATTSTAQTLTNKTIVVANNTVTTAAAGNLVATELNAALAELDGQDTTVQGNLDTHIADTTTHGTTGDIVGTTDTQTLTNKTLTSPTVNGGTHTDFTSTGIDDNATSNMMTISNGVIRVGDGTSGEVVTLEMSVTDDGRIDINGGNSAGAQIQLFGPSHAAQANDTTFKAGTNIWGKWDESVGSLTFSTGTGAKTDALTIDSNQDTLLSGDLKISNTSPLFTIDDSNATSPTDFIGYIRAEYSGTPTWYLGHLSGVSDVMTLRNYGAEFQIQTNGSNTALTIDSNQVVQLDVGQLKFPATQNPSADANTLDDYEEGTWTPVISDGTNDTTSSTAYGDYTKIGRRVFVKGRIILSSLGSVSGAMRITGLPFASVSTGNSHSSCCIGFASNLSITAGESITGRVIPATSYVSLSLWDNAVGVTNLLNTELTATSEIIFSAEYTT